MSERYRPSYKWEREQQHSTFSPVPKQLEALNQDIKKDLIGKAVELFAAGLDLQAEAVTAALLWASKSRTTFDAAKAQFRDYAEVAKEVQRDKRRREIDASQKKKP